MRLDTLPIKPLGHKAYGSIPHLIGSRTGDGDHTVHEGVHKILTRQKRDRHDTIFVQEKLDGSNVAIANVNGAIMPLNRSGYVAMSSPYEQHRLFAEWVYANTERFTFLKPGERLCGEWLAQAHGTRYTVTHPFVAFDIMVGPDRMPYWEFVLRVGEAAPTAKLLHHGQSCAIEEAVALLGELGHHNAIDKPEGCIWRCERHGKVEMLAKFVRPDYIPGRFLPETDAAEVSEPVWNWRP